MIMKNFAVLERVNGAWTVVFRTTVRARAQEFLDALQDGGAYVRLMEAK